MDGAFGLRELQRLYADYKYNGKKIDKAEFSIIFATYVRRHTQVRCARSSVLAKQRILLTTGFLS